MDELPMVYGSLMLHHAISKEPAKSRMLPFLFAVAVAITATMVLLPESHSTLLLSFGTLIATLVLRCIRISWRDGKMWEASLLSAGSVMYLTAFAAWLCTYFVHSEG
jgi:hypothetical protein